MSSQLKRVESHYETVLSEQRKLVKAQVAKDAEIQKLGEMLKEKETEIASLQTAEISSGPAGPVP